MGIILISGGAGFIGTNLVRQIPPGLGIIRVLDNFSSGRARDLEGLPVEIVTGDIRNPEDVDRSMTAVTAVVHLAAHTGVVESVSDPKTDMAINVDGTLNMLQAAVRHGVERFISASTGGAIAGDVTPPLHEDMPPCPMSPYGASKLAVEGYCSAFWGSFGLRTISLRFSNVYGPFSYHKGSVIAKFFRRVLRDEELIIYGDGEQTRDFLFVEDLCQAVVTALQADLPYGRAIQLGTGRETSINQLVTLMQSVTGQECFPSIKYAPVRAGEVLRNFVSVERARQYLRFHPTTDLEEGLGQTWKWFQETEKVH